MITPAVRAELQDKHPNRRHVFLYGIEAHVCVMQTTLDLVREGYTVHLPIDAVTSMWPIDREGAMERYRGMANDGVILSSAEGCMFELVGDATKAEFKKMVPLVKEYAAVKKKAMEGGTAASKL